MSLPGYGVSAALAAARATAPAPTGKPEAALRARATWPSVRLETARTKVSFHKGKSRPAGLELDA